MIQQGRDGGNWDGTGITSTTAGNNNTSIETYQLGAVVDGDLPSMPGTAQNPNAWIVGSFSEPLDGNNQDDVIVKYTYTGDFNLDGMVNTTDSSTFGLYYNHPTLVATDPWAFGDTDGNGKLNTTDSSTFGLVYGNGTAAGHTGAKTQL